MAVLTCHPSALFPGRGISPLRPPHSACLTSASGSCFPPAHPHPRPLSSPSSFSAPGSPRPGPAAGVTAPASQVTPAPVPPCLECRSPPHLSASPLYLSPRPAPQTPCPSPGSWHSFFRKRTPGSTASLGLAARSVPRSVPGIQWAFNKCLSNKSHRPKCLPSYASISRPHAEFLMAETRLMPLLTSTRITVPRAMLATMYE